MLLFGLSTLREIYWIFLTLYIPYLTAKLNYEQYPHITGWDIIIWVFRQRAYQSQYFGLFTMVLIGYQTNNSSQPIYAKLQLLHSLFRSQNLVPFWNMSLVFKSNTFQYAHHPFLLVLEVCRSLMDLCFFSQIFYYSRNIIRGIKRHLLSSNFAVYQIGVIATINHTMRAQRFSD